MEETVTKFWLISDQMGRESRGEGEAVDVEIDF